MTSYSSHTDKSQRRIQNFPMHPLINTRELTHIHCRAQDPTMGTFLVYTSKMCKNKTEQLGRSSDTGNQNYLPSSNRLLRVAFVTATE